jgi:hypothetical protein
MTTRENLKITAINLSMPSSDPQGRIDPPSTRLSPLGFVVESDGFMIRYESRVGVLHYTFVYFSWKGNHLNSSWGLPLKDRPEQSRIKV